MLESVWWNICNGTEMRENPTNFSVKNNHK